MKIMTLSATEARNRFFELIEAVAYQGHPVVVTRNNKELVRIIAEAKPVEFFPLTDEVISQTFGMCPKDSWPYEKAGTIKKAKTANISW